MTTVATDTVTATDAARDHQVEAIAGTTTTPTLPVATTGTESVKTATPAATVATVATVTDLIVDGIVTEGRPAAMPDATTSLGSTGGIETLMTTDVVAEETTGATMGALGGKKAVGLLRHHPRRGSLPRI